MNWKTNTDIRKFTFGEEDNLPTNSVSVMTKDVEYIQKIRRLFTAEFSIAGLNTIMKVLYDRASDRTLFKRLDIDKSPS